MTQRLVAALSVGLVFGGCRVSIAPPESAVRTQGEPIQILAPVPALPESLPVLALTPEIAPKDGINKLLNEERRDPQLPSVALVSLGQAGLFRKQDIPVSQDLVGVVEGDRLRAWLDVSKGEAHIYPSFNRLKPRDASNPAATRERALKLLDTFRLLPNDDTKYALASERVVKQSVARRLADGTIQVEPAQTVLGYLSARRTFDGIPVDGPGSRAQLAFGAGDSVLGLTRIWKRAQISERTVRAPSALDIEKRIREQLAPIAQQATALVDDIQLVYYDSNAKLMQPAIRFTVQLTPFGARSTRDKVYLHGYVAFEETDETPPSLFGAAGDPPHAAKNNDIELPVCRLEVPRTQCL